MSVRVQPAIAIRPDSEPPRGEPAVGGGVPQPVRAEALHLGASCPASQRAAESFPTEPLAAAAQPQVRHGRERVPLSFMEVGEQRLGGGRSDRNDPTASSLAASDGDQARDEVDVVELEVDKLPRPDGGLEHEADDGLVAAVVQGLLGG